MNKKILGFIILGIAIFFLDILPGPSDAVILPMYSMYSGADISPGNLSSIYLDYFIWSTVIGLIFLFISMNLLGWDMKRLWKKIDPGKYRISISLGILIVVLITFLDVSMPVSYLLMSVIPIWYLIKENDKSEALAIFLVPVILIAFGLGKLLSFVFARTSIPEVIQMQSTVVSWISISLGFAQITPTSLIISVLIGFLIIVLLTTLLREKF